MNGVYHLSRFSRNVGAASLMLWSTWTIVMLWMIVTEVPAEKKLGAGLFVAIFAAAVLGGSAWLLLAYFRHELVVTGDAVSVRGIFSSRRIVLAAVTEARWRAIGRLILWGDGCKVAIPLRSYEATAHEPLVRFFRSTLPRSVQRGWELYCYHRLVRPEQRPGWPRERQVLITRRRWDWYFGPMVAIVLLIGVASWWWSGNARALAAPVPLLLIWLGMRYTTPATGMLETRISLPRDLAARQRMFLYVAWLVVGVVLIRWCYGRQPQLAHPILTQIALILVLSAPMLLWHFLDDRRRQRRVREAASAVAEAWERGELAEANLAPAAAGSTRNHNHT